MTDIADIGRRHLADALAGNMHQCEVTEWPDENGNPVKIYWKPLTGKQQRLIDQAGTEVAKVCAMVKHRALDAEGNKIFSGVSLASLENDYDYNVIRALAFIIAGDIGQNVDDTVGEIEKE